MGLVPEIVNLPRFLDHRGNLSFVEEETHIPFKIERVFWIYDVPGGEDRGGHAYKMLRFLAEKRKIEDLWKNTIR